MHRTSPLRTSYSDREHRRRREIWRSKYALRACYRGWFERLRPFIVPGPSLEIGGGFGGFKVFWPALRVSDIVPTPGLDLAADGLRLPLADGSLANLLVLDLLHHLWDPHIFFDEAARVLRPGGRILAIEPWISPLSHIAYRLTHHEEVYFAGYHRQARKLDPWAGNLAMANILFARERPDWSARHPTLRIIHQRRFSVLDFQLAGGFKPYTFVPLRRLYDLVLAIDRRLDRLAPLCGFRILCVIERSGELRMENSSHFQASS